MGLENVTTTIDYRYFKRPIWIVLINYNCQEFNKIIHYNRLLEPNIGCGVPGIYQSTYLF